MPLPSSTAEPRATKRVVANVIRGSLGNLIEWYDWFAYASFSVYFASAIFPQGNQTAQLLSAAIVFAVGFFLRPIGSWVLGRVPRPGRPRPRTPPPGTLRWR